MTEAEPGITTPAPAPALTKPRGSELAPLGTSYTAKNTAQSFDVALGLLCRIISAMRTAADGGAPVDEGDVAVWADELRWVAQRMQADVDELAAVLNGRWGTA